MDSATSARRPQSDDKRNAKTKDRFTRIGRGWKNIVNPSGVFSVALCLFGMPVLLLSNGAAAQTSDKRIAQIISTKSDHSNSLALPEEAGSPTCQG
jgi:hypothetical protein